MAVRWQVGAGAWEAPCLRFLTDLYEAWQAFSEGQRQESWIKGLTAAVRLLQTCGAALPDGEIAAHLNDMAFPLLELAEVLESMPPSQVARLLRHPLIRRWPRAVAAACVEALMLKNWRRREAAEYIGQTLGVGWRTVAGWRDTYRRQRPATFAQLEAELTTDFSRRGRQRKDVAIYCECTQILAELEDSQLLDRIDAILQDLVVEKNDAERRRNLRKGLATAVKGPLRR